MRFDATINFGVLITLISFIVVAVAGYFRLAVGNLIIKHGDEMKKAITEDIARMGLRASGHETEDDRRFEKVADSLTAIQAGVAGAIVAGQQIVAMQARMEGFDRRLDVHTAQTDSRFAEDRKLNHDRYGEIGNMISRVEVRAARAETGAEEARRLISERRELPPAPASDPGA